MDRLPMDHITVMLGALSQLQQQHAALQAQCEATKEAAIHADVRAVLAAIEGEYQPQFDGMLVEIGQLEAQIKAAVLEYGRSVKGAGMQAVYMAGRVSWDDKFLQGYAATHEEILQARLEGKPSGSLRKSR